ncbi:MAG: hypothetical protein JSW06_01895 [Thermoplasmatales archaeon]|nr:MAG: hypothetical protein JSW06_01895 [Thermoplasmatales archaeon]
MKIKTTNLKLRCLLCGWELNVELTATLMGDNQVYELPDRYCAECHTLLDQVMDGVAEKEDGQD